MRRASNLDQANRKLDMMTTKNTKLETEIEALKTKLSEEQEKIIALEDYKDNYPYFDFLLLSIIHFPWNNNYISQEQQRRFECDNLVTPSLQFLFFA